MGDVVLGFRGIDCKIRRRLLHVTPLRWMEKMPASTAERVRKRRKNLRAMGLRPIQIWVPDTRQPGFAEECRRQAALAAAADAADPDLLRFLDAAWADLADVDE